MASNNTLHESKVRCPGSSLHMVYSHRPLPSVVTFSISYLQYHITGLIGLFKIIMLKWFCCHPRDLQILVFVDLINRYWFGLPAFLVFCCVLSFSDQQVEFLSKERHMQLLPGGCFNISAVNARNLDYISESILASTESTDWFWHGQRCFLT